MNEPVVEQMAKVNINGLEEVSSEKNGARILFATDDFFATAENLLKRDEPEWKESEYTEFGKWMDGWETRRKRIAGHDWTIIELGEASSIKIVCVDTAFFTGNYAPRFSLQAAYLTQDTQEMQNRKKEKMGTAASKADLEKVSELHSENWETLIPMTSLKSGNPDTRRQYFKLDCSNCFTHLRFNIFPDGGIARLRVYGQFVSDYSKKRKTVVPLCGKCVEFSNAHFGHPDNLMNLCPPKGMFDGWETARRFDRPPQVNVDDSGFIQNNGEEWVILKLDNTALINLIEVDTTHFKGNCPDNVKIEGTFIDDGQDLKAASWTTILHRTKLLANQSNGLKHPMIESMKTPVNYIKVTIAPDGGLARLRIYGRETDNKSAFNNP